MNQKEKIKQLIKQNDGIISTAQITDVGIEKRILYQYIKENNMEKISHGVYADSDAWIDGMYLIHLQYKQAVFSHETALYFHDLTDREPIKYEITLKTGYNPSNLTSSGIKVYTVKIDFQKEGVIMMDTSYGNKVPVYNLERTICDIIRNRNNMDAYVYQTALRQYVKRKDKDLRLLMKYAKGFHIDKVLKQYLEVLL